MAILLLGERRMNEEESEHIYICLIEGEKAFKKQLKGAENLKLPTDPIEASLSLNTNLRRMFNPNAETDDREARSSGQLDIEDEVEGATETGGSTRLRMATPAAMTDDELRDGLRNIGLTMPLSEIRALSSDNRLAVESYIGQVVAMSLGGPTPEEPAALFAAVPNTKIEERIALGPYAVVDQSASGGGFALVHSETQDVKEALADPIDAAFFCAQFNLERLRNADMTDDEVNRWVEAGPWGVEGTGVGGYEILAGAERETCTSIEDAFGRAARYNRSIAQRGNGWNDPPPRTVDADAVQELKAATEHGVADLESVDLAATE